MQSSPVELIKGLTVEAAAWGASIGGGSKRAGSTRNCGSQLTCGHTLAFLPKELVPPLMARSITEWDTPARREIDQTPSLQMASRKSLCKVYIHTVLPDPILSCLSNI